MAASSVSIISSKVSQTVKCIVIRTRSLCLRTSWQSWTSPLPVDVRRRKKRDLSSGPAKIHKTSKFLQYCSTLWKDWIDFLNLFLTSAPGMAPSHYFHHCWQDPMRKRSWVPASSFSQNLSFFPSRCKPLTHKLWISSQRFDFSDLKRGLRMFERPRPDEKLSFKNLHVDRA